MAATLTPTPQQKLHLSLQCLACTIHYPTHLEVPRGPRMAYGLAGHTTPEAHAKQMCLYTPPDEGGDQ